MLFIPYNCSWNEWHTHGKRLVDRWMVGSRCMRAWHRLNECLIGLQLDRAWLVAMVLLVVGGRAW